MARVFVSAAQGEGLPDLRATIAAAVLGAPSAPDVTAAPSDALPTTEWRPDAPAALLA
jgi:hypothetical protein